MITNSGYSIFDRGNDVQLIRECRMHSNAAIARKDADAVAKYWMADFIQIAGDGSLSKGKTKVLSEWKLMFKQSSPLFERLPDEIVINESGTMAWEKGKWNYKNEKYHGNYSAMWKKVRGEWLTQSELYVSLNA